MLRPHHKSYYNYFESKRGYRIPRYATPKFRRYLAVRRLLGREFSMREYHFLFSQVKEFLGNVLNSPREDKVDLYLRSSNKAHPGLFDHVNADFRSSMAGEEEVHPWKSRYRLNLGKRKNKFQAHLAQG